MLNKVIKNFGWHIEPLEIDHQIPFSKGGSQEDYNMVCSCKTCNRRKSDNDGWQKRKMGMIEVVISKVIHQLYPVISKEIEQELKQIKEN